ncbi:MAG: hypothetical protein MPJ24_04945 [Pirellulaceae bacterium]|nr:hypothetical protein [Pirellulaceae bacterium]
MQKLIGATVEYIVQMREEEDVKRLHENSASALIPSLVGTNEEVQVATVFTREHQSAIFYMIGIKDPN